MIDVIFGIPNPEETAMFNYLNFIIIHGKWYIYKCKIGNRPVIIPDFLTDIRFQLTIEKYILSAKGELIKFINKWGILNEALHSDTE